MNAQSIQSLALTALGEWESNKRSVFSWPMDCFCPEKISNSRSQSRSLHYHLHCAIVDAWNSENRETDCGEFHRKWLSDLSNIEKVVSEVVEQS